ncbi:MAG: DUF4416 family protein [Deltaproteobacteria bacterium]|nr:DUF4416 family protein [Deltaproteobacteria bacterium]
MNKQPVKYFAVIMTNKTDLLSMVLKKLGRYFGECDYASEWSDFTFTGFYEPEMGRNLKRCIVSFTKNFPPEILPNAKKWASKIEDKFRVDGKRAVNIDAGYIDHCKVVLASGKHGGHKIALTKACYADMIMYYQKGSLHPMPWCFPDFASGIYNKSLIEIRAILKATKST